MTGTNRESGPLCQINACKKPQGIGTWMHIRTQHQDGTDGRPLVVRVCEDHWQVIRNVR